MKKWIESPRLWSGFFFCLFFCSQLVAEQAQTSRPSQLDKAQALLKEGDLSAAKEEIPESSEVVA